LGTDELELLRGKLELAGLEVCGAEEKVSGVPFVRTGHCELQRLDGLWKVGALDAGQAQVECDAQVSGD